VALLALPGLTGCAGTALSRWRMATDDSLSPAPKKEEAADERNFLARILNPGAGLLKPAAPTSIGEALAMRGRTGPSLAPPPPDPEAEKEFEAAEELFQQGNLEEAEAAFAKLAKRKKDHPIGEKAQFYLAETQYQRGRFVKAHDSYEAVFKMNQGTKFSDQIVKREFAIGKIWLADSDPEAKPEDRLPAKAIFTGGRPLIDAHGFALKAFEHVRHHDPLGPLADDAVLAIAEQHYRDGDYESAALYFDELVKDHPKSPLVKRALLSSIDSKIKGYIGPKYDSTGLEEAVKSVEKARSYFPELRTSMPDEPDELDHTLDLIDDQLAERTYTIGEYYRHAGNVGGAKYYFEWVTKRWPKSTWNKKAEEQLVALAKVKEKRAQMSKIMTLPGSSDPFTGNTLSGGMNGSPIAGPNGMVGP
jgi:outer membrane protein assembly factor BamD (BamD/ComL family)